MRAVLLSVVLVLASLLQAQAQEGGPSFSRLYLGAAAADIGTTAVLFASNRYAYEGNPMYGWVMEQDRIAAGQRASAGQVAAVLAMSAAFDVASAWAVNRWVAPRHPKVARALFLIGAGVRGRQAGLNLSRAR